MLAACEVGEKAPHVILCMPDEFGESSLVATASPEGQIGDVIVVSAAHTWKVTSLPGALRAG